MAPLLVLLFFGIVEFGWLLFVRQTMVLAARSGARQSAIQGATEAEALTIAQNSLTAAGVSGATVTVQNAYTSELR